MNRAADFSTKFVERFSLRYNAIHFTINLANAIKQECVKWSMRSGFGLS